MPIAIGDIVRSTARWREDTTVNEQDHPWYYEDGYVIGIRGNIIDVRHRTAQTGRFITRPSVAWSAEYLELVHPLASVEAREIHDAYPQTRGRDYAWYLRERGLLPTIFTGLPVNQWQSDDIVRRTDRDWTARPSSGGGTVSIQVGDEVIVTEVISEEEVRFRLLDGRQMNGSMSARHLEFVRRPELPIIEESSTTPMPSDQWQVGDIVVRIATTSGWSNSEGGIPLGARARIVEFNPPDRSYKFQGLLPTSRELYLSLEDFELNERPPASYAWLPGDILQLTQPQNTGSGVRMQPGSLVRFIRSLDSTSCAVGPVDSDEEYVYAFMHSCMRWHARPVKLIEQSMPNNLSQLPPAEWQVGDIVQRVSGENWLGEVPIGGLVAINKVPGSINSSKRLPQDFSWRNEHGKMGNHHSSNYEFITREGFAVANKLLEKDLPMLPGIDKEGAISSDKWLAGDIVRRVASTREGQRMAIGDELPLTGDPSRKDPNVCVSIPGYGGWYVPRTDLLFVRREPRPMPWPLNVSVSGLSKAEREAFEEALEYLGMKRHDGDYGKYEKSPARSCNKLLIGYSQKLFLYYDGTLGGNEIGNLKDYWNDILRMASYKMNIRSRREEAKKVVIPRALSLYQLPAYAVIESQREETDTARREAKLTELGFPTSPGKYMLLAKGNVNWTDNAGVAKAFQTLHKGVWIGTEDDKQELLNVFNKRKLMLTKSAAQQRFALDVVASGGLLITAFKGFMAFSGYRQLHPEQEDGAYILVNYGPTLTNGKPDFATQPLTWQYANTYYKRTKLLNLSDDKGWEYMVDRISTNGVVRPIEQSDELDAAPQKGDSVVLINVAVTEEYPESEADLAFHAAGKTYTVKDFVKGLVQIKETGMLLHPDRLGVVGKPRGISSGDAVIMTDDYGALVKKDEVYTFMEDGKSKFGVLVNQQGDSYQVPPSHFRAATEEENKIFLLATYGITMPVKAKIINPQAIKYGEEVLLITCWPLSNKRLAFWTEEGTDLSAWYEREDFQVITEVTVNDSPLKILRGKDEVHVQVGESVYPVKALEEILATVYN